MLKKGWPYLFILIVLAFLLRVVWQWNIIFVDWAVFFRGTDSWYHFRLLENLLSNFPTSIQWDPYAAFPLGAHSGYNPLLHWVVYPFYLAKLPYQVVAAFVPPVAGALTLVPVYLIGKRLWGQWQGLLAALLVAILPTETFFRTMLGAYDHHCFEILLMPWIMYSLMKKSVWGLALSLGLYLLNWHGGAFVILPILIWYWLEFVLGLKNNEDTWSISKAVSVGSLGALVISLPASLTGITLNETLGSLSVLIFLPPALELVKRIFKDKEIILFVFTLLAPLAIIAVDQVISLGKLMGPAFWGWGSTIQETAPPDIFSLMSAFGLSILLALLGLIFLIKERGNRVLAVFALVMAVATIGETRWTYYLTINVALLAAFFTFYIRRWIKDNLRTAVSLVVVAFTLASIGKGIIIGVQAPNSITASWFNSMLWMRYNTPEPFKEGPDAYHMLKVDSEPSYAVASWWDYGHYIIQIAHRVPFDSPTHPSVIPDLFFLAQTEAEADKIADDNKIRYVVMDADVVGGKWYAVVDRTSRTYSRAAVELRPNSMALRLWENRATSWNLVHQDGDVKIWKKEE